MFTTLKRSAVAMSAGAALVVLAACGSSGGSGGTNTATQPQSSTGAAAETVTLHNTSLGNVLADASGRALYLLTADGAKLACNGGCLSIWAPLLVPKGSTPKAGSGVTGTLGVVDRGNNQQQVTIAGHPLYTYSGDSGPGVTSGQGMQSFGGTWYVVGPSGISVTASASGGSSSPSSNPYGY